MVLEGPASLETVAFPEGFEDLSGRHDRTLDDKARVVLPAGPWRELFAAGGKLTYWTDCLALWTPRSYRWITAELTARERRRELPPSTVRDLREDTVDVTPDGQGRIILSPELRHDAGIGDKGAEVVLIGNGERVEIWDRARRSGDRSTRPRKAAVDALRSLGL